MGYLEIKREIDDLNNRIYSLESEVRNSNSTVVEKQNEIESLKSQKGREIEDARKRALANFELEVCKPYRDKEDELMSLKVQLKNKHDELIRENTSERYEKKYRSELSLENTEKVVDEIRDATSNFYGDEIYNDLREFIVKDLDFDSELQDGESLISKINKITSLEDKKPEGVLDNVFELLNGIEFSKENPVESVVPAIILLVVLIVGIKFYPIIIIALVVLTVYNVYRSVVTLKGLSVCESFDYNKKSIEDSVKNYVDKCVAKKSKEIEDNYKNVVNKVEKQLITNENEMEIELTKRRNDFTFDSSGIENEFELRVKNVEQSIEMSKETSRGKEQDLDECRDELEVKERELRECLMTISNDFLPEKIIPNTTFPKEFLFGIEDDEPVTKPIPYGGCLFLYNDDNGSSVGDDFMISLYYQINSRVAPRLIRNIYYDEINMGQNLMGCAELDNVEIISDPNEWKTQTDEFKVQLGSRMKIMSNYSGIDEYNEFMLSIDSIPETRFIIFAKVLPDVKSVTDANNLNLIRNGSRYGFTEFVFLNYKDFLKKPTDDLFQILESISCCYYLSEDKIQKRSKEFLKREIAKNKNR